MTYNKNPEYGHRFEPGDLAELVDLGFQIEVRRVISREDGWQCLIGREVHSHAEAIVGSQHCRWIDPAQINLFGTWE